MVTKRIKATILLLAILPSMANMVYAQEDSVYHLLRDNSPCQSTFSNYSYIGEQSSIVRSNSLNHVVHTQRKHPMTGIVEHTFLIKSLYSGTEKAFRTNFNVDDSTCWSVDVTDMRLFNDACYFCGTIKYTYQNIITGEYVTHGIIGYFVPQKLLDGPGIMQYFVVNETAHLTHLAITNTSGSQVLVSAIGDKDQTGTACIVEAKTTTGQTWNLCLDTLETPKGVIFSDIMTVRDSIRLLMQYKCSNNSPAGSGNYDNRHQLFMMDCFDQNGCKANINSLVVHYLAHYNLAFDGNYYFHYNNAPMRLGHLNDKDKQFGVAFGVEENDGVHGGLRFFPFKNQWKYDSCIYYRMGRQTEIKEVGNLYETATLLLLSKDNQHTNGVATSPKLGSASHDVTQLYSTAYTLNSFTQKFVGDHIDISGHNTYKMLQLLDQDLTQLSSPSCFDKETFQYTPLNGQQAALLNAEWECKEIVTPTCVNLIYHEIEYTKSITCQNCNE